MKDGPDIALLGSLIGDPARANMLIALMSGLALTATELAQEAGITAQTASSHLKKLEAARLVSPRKQGRHRYFSLADPEIGHLLEVMMGVAATRGLVRTRVGPRDPALRKARICYDHLAGDLAVGMYDSLLTRGFIQETDDEVLLTEIGEAFITQFGIDLAPLHASKRPLCKACLDWSNRRSHLAGALGQALLDHFVQAGWCARIKDTRIVAFTPSGEKHFSALFALPDEASKPQT